MSNKSTNVSSLAIRLEILATHDQRMYFRALSCFWGAVHSRPQLIIQYAFLMKLEKLSPSIPRNTLLSLCLILTGFGPKCNITSIYGKCISILSFPHCLNFRAHVGCSLSPSCSLIPTDASLKTYP